MNTTGRIVVGVTGSPMSLAALRVAVGEARRRDVPLLAVNAWVPVGGETGYRRAPCPDLLRLWEENARHRLRAGFDEAFGGIPVLPDLRLLVFRGEPGHALVEVADRPDDLIVVGAGEQGAVARWLGHGRVARHVVSRAACPVLTVPAPPLLKALPWWQRHRLPLASAHEPATGDQQEARQAHRRF